MDSDESENAARIRQARTLNSVQVFVPETLLVGLARSRATNSRGGMMGAIPSPPLEGDPIRGRKPRTLTVVVADVPFLQAVARSRQRPFFQVEQTRIVLAMANGEPVQAIADRLDCDRTTVWRVGRRYEQGGRTALLRDEPRGGRPQEISPLQRAQLIKLACLEPIAEGLHITRWTSKDVARQAVADGIVEAIRLRTVRQSSSST
ncbi:helix-turn-helix domain-containing protein [Fimbriiglobus ruber]|uniref:helix-turn-helix domain-containing protein n=1 Tax=Fimbriiglobus ruber TaxID=1908690 RepID=UPI000B4B9349